MFSLVSLLDDKLSQFETQHLTNIVWSFANIRIRNLHVLDVIAERAVGSISKYSHIDCSITAWAFASLGFFDKPLLDAISQHTLTMLGMFDSQNLSNLVWAFAVFGICDTP